ncbi:MAG: hypothetical protein HZA50_03440 [Planctomycetes bacterium]|nr:hypothetical protein [Planctomycetota bacterium]
MEPDRAAAELKVLRQLMERPIRFSTMSGLSGIFAGIAALAGCAAGWHISGRFSPQSSMAVHMLVWAGVFVAAFVAAVVLTRIREIRRGMPLWSKIKGRILLTILPPFVIAAGLTATLVVGAAGQPDAEQWGLIPAIWMAFYGLTLWQIGDYAPPEVRLLGAAFLAGSLLSAAWGQQNPYWSLGLTFGGLHIVYGLIVWIRHGG